MLGRHPGAEAPEIGPDSPSTPNQDATGISLSNPRTIGRDVGLDTTFLTDSWYIYFAYKAGPLVHGAIVLSFSVSVPFDARLPGRITGSNPPL